MPVRIPDLLPATEILTSENIFVMDEGRAMTQDIRPLKILILNLMPTKIQTEIHLLRLLGNTPLQVDVTLLHPQSYQPKNTPIEHLATFYKYFEDVKDDKFDGLIITGAPVEHLEFEEVAYWPELAKIMTWSKKHVTSTFHICWGAQAGLYHHFGIPKHHLDAKQFGVFEHTVTKATTRLLRGFDDIFYVPHSRYTYTKKEDVLKFPELEILSESEDAGVYIITANGGRQVFVTGHSEYDPLTLKTEYDRDQNLGKDTAIPKNYYPKDDPTKTPIVRWRSHANLLFSNWLNYYVYQETPYDISSIE